MNRRGASRPLAHATGHEPDADEQTDQAGDAPQPHRPWMRRHDRDLAVGVRRNHDHRHPAGIATHEICTPESDQRRPHDVGEDWYTADRLRAVDLMTVDIEAQRL